MFIIKNALRCISRSIPRQVLIGIIVLVIAVSACLGLSIRQAAENARAEALSTLKITASISFDRQSMMSQMGRPNGEQNGQGRPSFDRSEFADMMGKSASLTLDEYKTYAAADSVQDFYYTLSVSLNGSEGFDPVTTDTEVETEEKTTPSQNFQRPDGMFGGGKGQMTRIQSDFSVIGCSNEDAMTDFVNGTASVTEGEVFTEGTTDYHCLITEELAVFNDLKVGDTVTVTNPNNEEEAYTLTVVGLYTDSSANDSSFSMMGATMTDPANKLYMSHAALQAIVDASAAVSTTKTDENTGREFQTGLNGSLAATYTFANIESYEQFKQDVRAMGLDESYTVTSGDLTSFENSLTPLNTLSKMASYFLLVILLIGAVILIVLNIFNVRERKYEIGVLTAMGMKKHKVALQFLTEIFVITMAAIIIGTGIGAFFSVPVTNALLEGQVSSQQNQFQQIEQGFGRPGDSGQMQPPGGGGGSFGGGGGFMPDGFANLFGGNPQTNYVTSVNAAMNMTVVLQMLGIAVLLTLAAGAVSMFFVMRYEPLRILANRD